MRKKIKFQNAEEVMKFTTEISTLESDINIYDGTISFDAKSMIAMVNLDTNKTFEVEVVIKKESEQAIIEEIIARHTP